MSQIHIEADNRTNNNLKYNQNENKVCIYLIQSIALFLWDVVVANNQVTQHNLNPNFGKN